MESKLISIPKKPTPPAVLLSWAVGATKTPTPPKKAAEELHIRQPSVTQQIKLLEKEYKQKTYKVNSGRGIELTQAGRGFLNYAKKILLQVDNLERELRSSLKRRHRHR
jgi:DNA-binding transcriptional LysR family regulator